MKKLACIALCFVMIFIISGCGKDPEIKYPYTQEYIAGQGNIKGNVNIKFFSEIDPAFEIGANAKGYAVFKNPQEAFKVLLKKYADGINLIRHEYKLPIISKKNYNAYEIYGWQVTTGTDAQKKQAMFVTQFFDTYENSFEGS